MTPRRMAALVPGFVLWVLGACSGTETGSSVPVAAVRSTADTTLAGDLVSSWGAQKVFFIEGKFLMLEWEAAQALLQQKTYRGGKMYHTGWITIYQRDGRRYLTKEPSTDAFLAFMRHYDLPMDGFAPE